MLKADLSDRSRDRAPGRLSRELLRLLMRQATIAASESLSDEFRLITFEGAPLAGVAWTPGQKIQIAMGSAFVGRTYTPIDWDPSAGRARILAFAHGDGPGSAWVRGVEAGDECHIFGPRASLDANRLTSPLAIFGDETSMGLAYALARADPANFPACHFEVGNLDVAAGILAHFEIDGAKLFAKRADEFHLEEMELSLPALIQAGASFVLTGRAGAIQRLRQSLKRRGVPAARIVTKAYWAPGKTGLD